MSYSYCVVGGGLVGLATARAILKWKPGTSVVLIEKEAALGLHQSSHNSGVIHSGVYYQPGSLKARLSRLGGIEVRRFCEEHSLPYKNTGKLIVATNALERERLAALEVNAEANGVAARRVGREELLELEPKVDGLEALQLPETGIVDYGQVSTALGAELEGMGAEIILGERVMDIVEEDDGAVVRTDSREVRAKFVITCGGLQADRLASLTNEDIGFRIVPFKGEYYTVTDEKAGTFEHLIYPVPDPSLPFLGVHFTPTIGGALTIGPNALLAFHREGYGRFAFNPRDAASSLSFAGLWRLAAANWKFGIDEGWDSISKSAYLRRCQRYWPELELADFERSTPGIRAQALLRDGGMVSDFYFLKGRRTLHVCNAPSPAATASLPIGALIAERMRELDWIA